MGQKVNPHGLRVGVIAPWGSKWYANKKDFGKYIKEDYEIRKYLKKMYYDAAISKINIERAADNIKIDMYCGRVGIAIGKLEKASKSAESIASEAASEPAKAQAPKKGRTRREAQEAAKAERGIDQINKAIAKIVGHTNFNVNILEVKNVDMDAQLVAESIAAQLERRMPFRRAMKYAMGRSMRAGAKGIKVTVGGRLDGAEIARSESYHEGSIPLQTIRANINYGFAEAKTTYGILGVKVWIYKGEIFKSKGGND